MKTILILPLFLLTSFFIYSQSFHDTKGNLDVSSSGSVNYTIPIANPPSLGDVAPEINLVYTSSQFGGIAGQGWNIQFISSIFRISSRKDIDDEVDAVDFDDNDKLALDGQRLILKSGQYWEDGSTYETEIFSNTKIELFGSGENLYFIVTNPDGSRAWYGNFNNSQAKDITSFYINRFEDINGNYIEYSYSKPLNRNLCITSIKYSANTNGILPINEIKFNYTQALRSEMAYLNGNRIEKIELLESIDVYTNSLLFRRYKLSHASFDSMGYQKLTQIQEFNGENEPSNPIIFEYNQTTIDNTYNSENYKYFDDEDNEFDEFKKIELSGDFDGDGLIDFVSKNKLVKGINANQNSYPYLNILDVGIEEKFRISATTLKNNQINQKNSIVAFQINENSTNVKTYNLSGSVFTLDFSKSILMNNTGLIIEDDCINGTTNSTNTYIKDNYKFIDGDFNADGISDVLIVNPIEEKYINTEYINGYGQPSGCRCDVEPCSIGTTESTSVSDVELFWLDLNPNSSTELNSNGFIKLSNINFNYYDKIETGDFDGDGKTDIFVLKPNNLYIIYSLKFVNSNSIAELIQIGTGTLNEISNNNEKVYYFGDFNGDRKTDILIPDNQRGFESGPLVTKWRMKYGDVKCSTCEAFSFKSNPRSGGNEYYTITNYQPLKQSTNVLGQVWEREFNNYYIADINNDGKSDLIKFWQRITQNGSFTDDTDTLWKLYTYANNVGYTNSFNLEYESPDNHRRPARKLMLPIISNSKYNGKSNEILIIDFEKYMSSNYKRVYFINFTKEVNKDILLNKVITNGGSIEDEISYRTLEYSQDGFYRIDNTIVDYPFVKINKLPTSYFVSKLKNTYNQVSKYMDFKYRNLTINYNGLGLIGFQKTLKSSWYQNENEKIWNISIFDPLKRGSLISNFTSFTEYGTAISENINEYDIINENNIFKIYLIKQKSKDYLTGVVNEKIFETYDLNYLLPTKIVEKSYTNNNSQIPESITITNNEYLNNVNGLQSNYFIGRPKSIETITTAYNDTFKTLTKFTYDQNRLIKSEKKGNTSEEKYLVEEFDYDLFGNVIKKTLSSSGYDSLYSIQPRIEEYTYDTSGRFISSFKDVQGLTTNYTVFHPKYGLVKKVIDPYGRTSNTEYDNWGKVTKTTDYLGKNQYINYSRNGNEYTTITTGDDQSASLTISNSIGQLIIEGKKDIQNNWSYIKNEYDFLGRKIRSSEPYLSSQTPSLWTNYEYDNYSRIYKTTFPSGLVTNITYNGLAITTSDGYKVTTSIKNANNHLISNTDNGGTINYNYYANGNLKSTFFGSNQTSYFYYNEWGKKKQMNDVSLGTYYYEYNAVGELLKETRPGGYVQYELDGIGKILTEIAEGNNIKHKKSYSYDNNTKLIVQIKLEDLLESPVSTYLYNYVYDDFKRIYKFTENLSDVKFETITQYDSFGRLFNEYYNATDLLSNKTSNRYYQNEYKNGYLFKIRDGYGGTVLYEVNSVNERGQINEATLGANYNARVKIFNNYDVYGINSGRTFKKISGTTQTDLFNITNPFDPQKGNLLSRYNSLYGWVETFEYDNLDRLTKYLDTNQQYVIQSYDTNGRIQSNEVGTYNYSNSSKPYYNSSINVNNDDLTYYQNRFGVYFDDMENSKYNWNLYNYNGSIILGSFDTSFKQSGDKSLKVQNSTSTEVTIDSKLWVPINNNVSTQYTYSGWVYSNAPQAEILLFMKTDTETGAYTMVDNVVSTVTNQWVFVQKTFTVPANIKKLRLRLDNNGNGTVWFDNVNIRKTSETQTSQRQLDVVYTALNRVKSLTEPGIEKIDFMYNIDNERAIMYYGSTVAGKLSRPMRKYYSSNGIMEIKKNMVTNEVEFITYVGGNAYTAPIILKSDGTTSNFLFLHRDYQGSVLAISDINGQILEKRLFDAWGNPVRITNKWGENINKFIVFDRGYTGHEHLMGVGLINMNARLYDPKLHRFIQADEFMQDPNNTQYQNRYTYALNNPLRYTDPDGNNPIPFIIAAAFVSGATYFITALNSLDIKLTGKGMLSSMFFGALSAAASFGVGTLTSTINQFFPKMVVQALMHGSSQMIISGISGGDPISSFASGSFSSIVSSVWGGGGSWKGLGGNFAQKTVGILLFGTVSGGLGAKLTGGNFWNGATTGLFVSGLNHMMHKNQQKGKDFETMLRNKLKELKINESIDGKELNFIDKLAGWGINKITRESETKFSVDPTVLGGAKIDDGAYIIIEDGKTITGNFYDKGFVTVKGIRITTFGMPKTKVGGIYINQFLINKDHGFYQVDNQNINAFKLNE